MTKDILKTSSKYLSLILRHQPDSIGLTMNAQGWVAIDELISKANIDLDSALIAEIVATSDKQRFAFSDDGLKIRAIQYRSTFNLYGKLHLKFCFMALPNDQQKRSDAWA